jgi:hypothetical protein
VDADSGSAWLNYRDSSGTIHQVWFDTPHTLAGKFKLGTDRGLLGRACFAADYGGNANISASSPALRACTASLWSILLSGQGDLNACNLAKPLSVLELDVSAPSGAVAVAAGAGAVTAILPTPPTPQQRHSHRQQPNTSAAVDRHLLVNPAAVVKQTPAGGAVLVVEQAVRLERSGFSFADISWCSVRRGGGVTRVCCTVAGQ